MFSAPLALLLVASSLATASPVPNGRTASVIRVASREEAGGSGGDKVFNVAAARVEGQRLALKFGSKAKPTASEAVPVPVKREHAIEAFDIQELRSRKRAAPAKGKVALTDVYPDYDGAYTGSLSLGTPAQKIHDVLFDTGSTDLLISTSNCQNCTGSLFDTSSSTTYRPSTTPVELAYIDGSSASGVVAKDVLKLAGLSFKKQAFAAIETITADFGESVIFGLGLKPESVIGANPFFINLVNEKKLLSNVFSFFFARHDTQKRSEICIGCKDSAHFTGEISYYPLKPTITGGVLDEWSISGKGLSYNKTTPAKTPLVQFDTGTSTILVPVKTATKFYARIKGAKAAPQSLNDAIGFGTFWTIPCTKMEHLAPVTFVFGTKHFEINTGDFNLGRVSETSPLCVGGIVGADLPGDESVLGIEFLKTWYSVYDYGHRRVGLARAVQAV